MQEISVEDFFHGVIDLNAEVKSYWLGIIEIQCYMREKLKFRDVKWCSTVQWIHMLEACEWSKNSHIISLGTKQVGVALML